MHMSGASKRKEKPKWTIQKPKLDNARKSRGIHFIDPEDEEFEEIMENARRKLEIQMPAAVPCKTSLCQSSRETCSAIGGHKTKYACIVEADESMRIRLERAPHRYHEDHIAGKGMNSQCHYASSNENTRCKGSSGKKGKTRENPGMAADESQKQK